MKVSFITTILNEEKTIISLLTSLTKQTQKPNEVIIVDGGSKDKTIVKIKAFQKKHPQIKIRLSFKKGTNRSQGRNLAIGGGPTSRGLRRGWFSPLLQFRPGCWSQEDRHYRFPCRFFRLFLFEHGCGPSLLSPCGPPPC